MGGKFSDAMNAAKAAKATKEIEVDSTNQQIQPNQSVNTDLQIDSEPVSITIKVPRYLREYWQIETRKARTTMTSEIIDFLTKKYGTPN